MNNTGFCLIARNFDLNVRKICFTFILDALLKPFFISFFNLLKLLSERVLHVYSAFFGYFLAYLIELILLFFCQYFCHVIVNVKISNLISKVSKIFLPISSHINLFLFLTSFFWNVRIIPIYTTIVVVSIIIIICCKRSCKR